MDVLIPKHAWGQIPLLTPTYTEWENTWRARNTLRWMRENSWFPIAVTTLYILFVVVGKRVMDSRKPFKLVNPLAYWNLLLSVFSFAGAFRTVPVFVYLINKVGVEGAVCAPVKDAMWADYATGFWVCAFCLSKIPELVDTIFIIIRKKPLIFLHWYHHATVLLYCWHSYVVQSPSGLPFVAMNYSVHAVMYLYYFAKAKRLAFIDAVPPIFITALQIIQMVGGIYICIMSLYFRQVKGEVCKISETNTYFGLAMYFSYFALFLNFFLGRYCSKRPSKGKDADAKQQ